MRILIIPDYEKSGGTRKYFENLLEYYADRDYVAYILLKNKYNDPKIRKLISSKNFRILKRSDFSFIYKIFGSKIGLVITNIVQAAHLFMIKILIRPKFVVYSQGNIFEDILQLVLNKRFLYIVHSYPVSHLNSTTKYLLNKKLDPHNIILTVSQYARDRIVDYWVTADNSKYISFIYNYVKMPNRKKCDLHEKDLILTLGHVVDYKNPYLWIDVANRIIKKYNIKFVWAGEGPLLERCRHLVSNNNHESIKFVGFVDNVQSLYERATVYLQLSKVESHGISVLEAMSFGIPCIVSGVGGLPETIEDGVNGFVVDITDKESVIEKVQTLLNNDVLRNSFGKKGISTVKDKFSKEIWYKNMDDIHDKILT